MNVTRQEALDFLNIAARNWPELPPLSEDDIGDVATALLAFVIKRLPKSEPGAPDHPAKDRRLPYKTRLQVGRALDRLVCDESTPTQVETFIRTFAEFGLVIERAPPEIDGGRFADWSLKEIAGQCRMQSREQLDPEFSQFMAEVARRLFVVCGLFDELPTSTATVSIGGDYVE